MRRTVSVAERRGWERLPISIPFFVRGTSASGEEFLEFATALNVSAGGMLVAVRRAIPFLTEISLEIPSSPLAALASLPRAARTLLAKVVRTEHAATYNLIGLKFSRPLVGTRTVIKTRQRKFASTV